MDAEDPKSLNHFATVSTDGSILFWDMRVKINTRKLDVQWAPSYTIPLSRIGAAGEYPAVHLLLGVSDSPVTFMCSTEVRGFHSLSLLHVSVRSFSVVSLTHYVLFSHLCSPAGGRGAARQLAAARRHCGLRSRA